MGLQKVIVLIHITKHYFPYQIRRVITWKHTCTVTDWQRLRILKKECRIGWQSTDVKGICVSRCGLCSQSWWGQIAGTETGISEEITRFVFKVLYFLLVGYKLWIDTFHCGWGHSGRLICVDQTNRLLFWKSAVIVFFRLLKMLNI